MMDGVEAGNGNTNDGYENESIEMGSPFAQIFGPEILDFNLSDFEFRLLAYLRITAGRNGSTWMSHKQIAKHLGKGVRSVERAYSGLRAKGYVNSWPRDWGRSDKKILTAPSKIYGFKRMRRFFDYLKADADDEEVEEIRSIGRIPKRIDNPSNLSTATSDGTEEGDDDDDIDNPSNLSTAISGGVRTATSDGINAATSDGINTATSGGTINRSHEVNKDQLDHSSDASHHGRSEDESTDSFVFDLDHDSDQDSQKKTTSDQRLAIHIESKPVGEESKNISDEQRQGDGQAATDSAVLDAKTQARVDAEQKALSERQAFRVLAGDSGGKRYAESTEKRFTGKPGMNARDLGTLYVRQRDEFFPGGSGGEFKAKELNLAVDLIKEYGWEMIEKVLVNTFRNWSVLSKKMNNDALFPSMPWIYATRNQLFGEFQKKEMESGKGPKRIKAKKKKLGESF